MILPKIMNKTKKLILHNWILTDKIKKLNILKKIKNFFFNYQKVKAKYHNLDFLIDIKN